MSVARRLRVRKRTNALATAWEQRAADLCICCG